MTEVSYIRNMKEQFRKFEVQLLAFDNTCLQADAVIYIRQFNSKAAVLFLFFHRKGTQGYLVAE